MKIIDDTLKGFDTNLECSRIVFSTVQHHKENDCNKEHSYFVKLFKMFVCTRSDSDKIILMKSIVMFVCCFFFVCFFFVLFCFGFFFK